jgi:membrane-associated protease RseP (regulator of RpoE activity)
MPAEHRAPSTHGFPRFLIAAIATGMLIPGPTAATFADENETTIEKRLIIVADPDNPNGITAPPNVNVRVIEMPEDKRLQVRVEKLEKADASTDWKGAKLGVAIAAEIPAAVRAQIDAEVLPAGFGVLVEQVEPGSAAAKAGIEPFDILLQFEDQKLVSSEQLIALVGSAKGNAPVSITLLRGGRRKAVKVRLIRDVAGTKPTIEYGSKKAAATPKDEQTKDNQVIPSIPNANLPPNVQELLKQIPQGTFQFFGGNGAPFGGTVMTQTSTVMATDNGTITITDSNGNRTVTIKDSFGKEIFAGPVNNADEWEKVPEPFRKQLPKP